MSRLLKNLRIRLQDTRPRRRLFDFLVPGMHKGGTTWLHRNLQQHPDIHLPFAKELSYFDYVHRGIRYGSMLERYVKFAKRDARNARANGDEKLAAQMDVIAAGVMEPDENWYRCVFKTIPNSKISGEFTPEYFSIGEAGLQDMRRLAPKAKIIIFIREPKARMISALSMAIRMAPNKNQTTQVRQEHFLRRGDCIQYLPLWDKVFGEQILYLPFGDIATAPQETLAKVEAFLGLSPFKGYCAPEEKFNSHSGKVELCPEALEEISSAARPQKQYLQNRFGTDFCNRI